MSTTGQNGSDADFFVSVPPGGYVFHEGDEGNSMYIIEEGVIEIVRTLEAGERKLADLEQGDFFGELSLLDDQPREASARAASECQLLRIEKATFDQMLRQNPEIAVRMLRKLARRLRSDIGTFKAKEVAVREEPQAPPAAEPRVFKLIAQETGAEIVLPEKAEITVGRPDPVTGIAPDIDLTTHDTGRSVSRRHAKIYHRGDEFQVCEEIGTANGTFVNDQRIKTGVPVPLTDNDVVSFGRVAMLFRQY